MKRLFVAVTLLLLVGGCQTLKPAQVSVEEKVEVVEVQRHKILDLWLQQTQQIMSMNQEQLQQQLKTKSMTKPIKSDDLFRYALLNQQLKDRLGWIRARDSLRLLKKSSEITDELASMVDILLLHNQSMINADARESRLHEALSQSQNQQQIVVEALQQSHQKTLALEKKIAALTSLERSMSIRRALTTDAPKESVNE